MTSFLHLAAYSVAFGGLAFYSYVASPIAFKVLERPAFSQLQLAVFPKYFIMQTAVPALLYATAPAAIATAGVYSLGAASVFGGMNYFWLLPWLRRVKEERLAATEGTPEYQQLTAEFGKSHGLSLGANLGHVLALASYGFYLARLLK